MQPPEPKPQAGPAPSDVSAGPPVLGSRGSGLPAVAAQSSGSAGHPSGTSRKKGGRFRSRRARLSLALGAGLLALLCLGGLGVFVAIYDDATEIKRTDPTVVLVSFLGAYLTDRNDQQADLYVCNENADFTQLSAFRENIRETEGKYSVGVMVTWKNLAIHTAGSQASATVDIVRTIAGGAEETFDPWKFEMSDQGGWRVCSATPGS